MSHLLRITFQDIERLNDIQLTELLSILLHLEASSAKIPSSAVHVPLKITVSDEGEDGRIIWQGGPKETNWIPKRFTLFQCKATNMTTTKCGSELKRKKSKLLKEKVEEVLDAEGCYILFYNKSCNTKQQTPRIKEMRKTIKEAGKPYADPADIRIYDANKIASWVNQFIPAIVTVCNYVGKSYIPGLQCWKKRSGYTDSQYDYVMDEQLSRNVNQLRVHFEGTKKIARIVGLSGLGKTRLAIEAFRPPQNNEDVNQMIKSDQVVFIDAANNIEGLPGIVSSWVDSNLEGILVVDNCDISLHKKLKLEIEHPNSKLSLLTLDYNPEKSHLDHPFIELKPVSKEVTVGILEQAYTGLPKQDVERIAHFAEGFPQMAVLLADARLKLDSDIGSLREDDLVDKLLWGRKPEDPVAKKVISACALFDYLGFSEDVIEHRNFVAEKICGMDKEEFYEKTTYFLDRGILDKRGRFIRVTPRPLAIRLAADWWKSCSPERAIELVTSDLPNGLAEPLCQQMSKLHFLPAAQELTRNLCGPQAPFGQAEVLNSEEGSRLFRSLVEVNPTATADALAQVFGDWSREKLLDVGPGRRNLIWALEKLCFWKDTFDIAAPILCSFAAAENESWGNNATGQFTQLFHVVLSGTQANFKERLAVIDRALKTAEPQKTLVCIQALGDALLTGLFSRSVGVELQGSRAPQEEYIAETAEEVLNYWKECLNRLSAFACQQNEFGIQARKLIAERIRGLVQQGLIPEVETSLTNITGIIGGYWPEAQDAIQNILKYDGDSLSVEHKDHISNWLDLLTPNSTKEKLKLIVSVPPWNHEENDSGQYIDISEVKAIEFAEEQAKQLDNLIPNLEVILEGEQRQGYVFGQTLAKNTNQYSKFIEAACSVLCNLPKETQNPIVLGGFLSHLKTIEPDLVDNAIEFLKTHEMYDAAFNIIRIIGPDRKHLQKVLELLNAHQLDVLSLRSLQYGGVLKNLTLEDFLWFVNEILKLGEDGVCCSLDLLFMYTYRNKETLKQTFGTLRSLILTPNLINNKNLDYYHWQESVKYLIKQSEKDLPLLHHISNEIIKASSEKKYNYNRRTALQEVLQPLLAKHYSVTWPLLSEALMQTDNWYLSDHLMDLFRFETLLGQPSVGVLSVLPDDYLITWCSNELRAQLLSKIAPIFNAAEGELTFSPVIKFIIDNYGHIKDIRINVYKNMTPNGWSGSIIPYYHQAKLAMNQLLEHSCPDVRKWARETSLWWDQIIEKEQQREDEHDIGIY